MKINAKTIVSLLVLLALVIAGISACQGKKTGQQEKPAADTGQQTVQTEYSFRYDDYLQDHYRKHGIDMGFDSTEEYLEAANAVISNPEALTKTEKEDGDTVYYVKKTNEFVVLSTDGYIRTYFYPRDGINYFNRQ
ncbi:MAG: hypothetical protein MJ161_02680 [Clostridia bacterium]|nr:hypothetical protein [Clostridia bacterium]